METIEMNGQKVELSSSEYFEQLIEAIQEDLLASDKLEQLMDDPKSFLSEYTGSDEMASEIFNQIVYSFFVSTIETKEKKNNTRQVLADSSLSLLSERLADGTEKISTVDLSTIFKNLNKEQ